MKKVSNGSIQTLTDIVHSFATRGSEEAVKFYNGFRVIPYSYEDLYKRCCQCAAFLTQLGLKKGDRILLWAPNGPEWIVVQGACALTGVVSIPLDIRNTPDFILKIQEEVEARYFFQTQYKSVPGLDIQSIFMESLFEQIEGLPEQWESPVIQPDDWISIFYTSGTTGRPKGVILTHGNIASNIVSVLKIIHVEPSYRLLSVLPLSHAFEQTCGFWAPLHCGAKVLYLKSLKPSALFEMFQREKVALMLTVPRLLGLIKHSIEKTMQEKNMGGYLRLGQRLSRILPRPLMRWYFAPVHKKFGFHFQFFVSGGASLPRDVEVFWRSLGFEVVQGYGLTECSPILCANEPGKTKVSSVGPAIPEVEVKLGEGGEVLAKGPNIFQGYFKQPEITASVFADGWFKTGDVAEIDKDDYVFIRSRKKDIIVTSDGVNVYPEDIEDRLATIPGIKDCCVIGVGEHEETVHAVVILNEGGNLEGCIKEVNQTLPPEQQIASYSLWPLKEFPKTTTLKIKKNEVRKMAIQKTDSQKTEISLPKQHPLHTILFELGKMDPDALRADARLGQELGLSSIDRVELISRMEEEFRMDIDDQMVTAETTVGALEEMIQKRDENRMQLPIRRWTLGTPCHIVREVVRATLVRGLLKTFCKIQAAGLENVRDLRGPVLFVANHTSHVDTPLIMQMVPYAVGSRICPAASKEYFDVDGRSLPTRIAKSIAWNLSTTLMNIFPMAQTVGYRQSIAYAGELVDKGWSVLLFPEGSRTEEGELGEFMTGVGLMAKALQVPLVPVAILGAEKILHRGDFFPKRGPVYIAFGKPFLPTEKSYNEVTVRVKSEIFTLFNLLKANQAASQK